MNNKYKGVLLFATGVIIGSLATWKFVKTKYIQIAQEEIDSVKEVFSRMNYEEVQKTASDYEKILKSNNYETKSTEKGVKNSMIKNNPRLIQADELGDCGYEVRSWTYYADDGTLEDEFGEEVTNVDETVGFESLKHFGDYEDDAVFVRNDDERCDYEILLDVGARADNYKENGVVNDEREN